MEYGNKYIMDKSTRDKFAKAYYKKDKQAQTAIIMREFINILTEYYSPIKTQ